LVKEMDGETQNAFGCLVSSVSVGSAFGTSRLSGGVQLDKRFKLIATTCFVSSKQMESIRNLYRS
jgi:hypothetical protein